MEQKELSVVFLMWVPYGIGYLKSFVASYIHFDAGAEHNLVILFNGYDTEESLNSYHQFLKDQNISYTSLLIKSGQDIAAYRYAGESLTSKYVLFFNTYSEILSQGWGKYYLKAIGQKNVGCAGASGSWQSRSSYGFRRVKWIFSRKQTIESNIPHYSTKKIITPFFSFSLFARLSLLAALIKSLRDLFSFPFFPNAHLRTNAFIVDRVFWLGLHFNALKTKRDAYKMESGAGSFTRQIQKAGLIVVVVNKYGDTFKWDEWNRSRTMWNADQEDLLISDNFTKLYDVEDPFTRRVMSKSVWE